MKTVIIGATDKTDRPGNKAISLLTKHGHDVVLVHPSLKTISIAEREHPIPVRANIAAIPADERSNIHTITMYVNASISDAMAGDIVALKPKRVIFNPGSENPRLAVSLRSKGIAVEEACTLVLLQTGQF